MNKFQPKIADFGCEIVDAISNGLKAGIVSPLEILPISVICKLDDDSEDFDVLEKIVHYAHNTVLPVTES